MAKFFVPRQSPAIANPGGSYSADAFGQPVFDPFSPATNPLQSFAANNSPYLPYAGPAPADPSNPTRGKTTFAQWLNIVNAGYSSGQTTDTYVDDVIGAISAYATGGPWALAVYAVVNIFSRQRARRREDKLRRQQAERTIETLDDQPISMPLVYGFFRRQLTAVFAAGGPNMPVVRPISAWKFDFDAPTTPHPADGNQSIGQMPAEPRFAERGLLGARQDVNYILMTQYDIAANEVDAMYDLVVDGIFLQATDEADTEPTEPMARSRIQDLLRFWYSILGKPGIADLTASAFQTGKLELQRSGNSKFTNKAYLTTYFWQNQNNPLVNNIPTVEFFGAGSPVRSVERTGDGSEMSPFSYSLSTTKGVSVNPVLIELDRLMTRQKMTEDEFDLESWYESQERANVQWSGEIADMQYINARRPTIVLREGEPVREFDDSLNLNYEELLGGPFHRVNMDRTEVDLGYSAISYGEVIPTFIKRQWMFCGEIPTNIAPVDQQEIILECLPGAFVYRDRLGRAAISTPDYITDEADQSEGVMDEDVISGRPNITFPEGTDILTSLNCRFRNLSKRMEYDDIIFPVPGSDLDRVFLEYNNNEVNQEDITFEGAVDPDQVHSLAISAILQSHRFVGECRVKTSFIADIREGSIVHMKFKSEKIDHYVQILRKLIVGPITLVSFKQFHREDYAWYPTDIEPLVLPERVDLRIPPPAEVEEMAPVPLGDVGAPTFDYRNPQGLL